MPRREAVRPGRPSRWSSARPLARPACTAPPGRLCHSSTQVPANALRASWRLAGAYLRSDAPVAYSLTLVAQINKPRDFVGEAQSTSQLLERIKEWHDRH